MRPGASPASPSSPVVDDLDARMYQSVPEWYQRSRLLSAWIEVPESTGLRIEDGPVDQRPFRSRRPK
jgi:hypothetical protein